MGERGKGAVVGKLLLLSTGSGVTLFLLLVKETRYF
jgi:hypothetical protein